MIYMAEIVEQFFSGKYEEKINKNILFFSFSEEEVAAYVENVINEPLSRFLAYMDGLSEKERIEARDVFQFSNLDDGTAIFCEKMKKTDNPGMKFLDIGRILLDDGKERKDGALVKYGENHVKTAEMLGLSFELCNTYYLSGIGYIYADLSREKQEKFLTRLVLRNKLVTRLYQASRNGRVNMREFLYMLSDSTYIRRRSNVKAVLGILMKSDEVDFTDIIELIQM